VDKSVKHRVVIDSGLMIMTPIIQQHAREFLQKHKPQQPQIKPGVGVKK